MSRKCRRRNPKFSPSAPLLPLDPSSSSQLSEAPISLPSPPLHISVSASTIDPMSFPRPLLLASLGNPAPYTNTLHSAGHHLLDALRVHLSLPVFSRSPSGPYRISHSAEPNPKLTLWRSSSLMNVSGKEVKKVRDWWLSSLPTSQRARAMVIIFHDELEMELGRVRVREGKSSAKGHNGLKSVKNAFGGDSSGEEWMRLGIGVGRPESREADDVSRYVLREMTGREIQMVRGAAEMAAREVEKIARGPRDG